MPISLDEFEREKTSARGFPTAPKGRKEEKKEYQAFSAMAHPVPTVLFRVNRDNPESSSFPSYGYLQGGTTDGNGFLITLTFPGDMGVRIHGRNLEKVLDMLLLHHAVWVQEFDPRAFDNPAEGEPLVTGIDIRRVA